jgi:hypothetical protein
MHQTRDLQSVLETFRQHGGVLRTGQALMRGIHPAALYSLVESGQLTRLARGLYRLADAQEFSNPDLAVVASKAPDAVVCLISALSFHGITTQVPRAVYLAVSRGRYAGLRLRTPPVKIYRFDAATFDQGIETHQIDGVSVHIYGVARTLVNWLIPHIVHTIMYGHYSARLAFISCVSRGCTRGKLVERCAQRRSPPWADQWPHSRRRWG